MLPLKFTGFAFFQCLLQGEHINKPGLECITSANAPYVNHCQPFLGQKEGRLLKPSFLAL